MSRIQALAATLPGAGQGTGQGHARQHAL
jgi:hypothetical protein